MPHIGWGPGMNQLGLELRPKVLLDSVCDNLGIKTSLRGRVRRDGNKSGLVRSQFKSFDGDSPNFLLA